MSRKLDYTTLAHRYTARYPLLTYVGTQVNFWIIANILLFTLMRLQAEVISHIFKIPWAGKYSIMVLIATILGIFYGVSLGLINYYLDKRWFRHLALGKIIIFKSLTSLATLVLLTALLRYVLFEYLVPPSVRLPGITLDDAAWKSLFMLLLIYYFFMTLVISFINQVNKKYGPGILIPLLLGRYRSPKEEDRIFMFMDLRSSTTTAEQLGHLKYSLFIQDCFSDINTVLYPFCAQVYQYVGDEIVVTWPESEGLKDHYCIAFYFACKKQFQQRAKYYTTRYGFLPDFKAGIHAGTVTTVEIGEYKRDIAYHGDTLNTAARIQGVCNEYNKRVIASKSLIDKVGEHPNMRVQALGMVQLKGKREKVELVGVEWTELSEV